MHTLLSLVEERHLIVTDYTPGEVSVSMPVMEGTDNRFQIEVLELGSDEATRRWFGSEPGELLDEGLAEVIILSGNIGVFKLRLADLYGDEEITFMNHAMVDDDDVFEWGEVEGLNEALDPLAQLREEELAVEGDHGRA